MPRTSSTWPAAGRASDDSLKVLAYNIWAGGEDRLRAIAAVVRRQRPDAVALLEVDRRAADALANELEMELAYGQGNAEYHVAWLSGLPIRRAENHRLPALAKTLVEIELKWDGAPLHLFAAHLASSHEEPVRPRLEEVRAILGVLRPPADRLHVLVGDLNSLRVDDPVGVPPPGVQKKGEAVRGVPRPVLQQLVDAGYVDCFRMLHPGRLGYTYPADAPWLRLDYIFASPRIAPWLRACEVVGGAATARASDHLPIWAVFQR